MKPKDFRLLRRFAMPERLVLRNDRTLSGLPLAGSTGLREISSGQF